MQIIAESGASKTDWRWIKEDGTIGQAKTIGINAYHISHENLISVFSTDLSIPEDEKITKVSYYGAGCGSTENKEKIKKALKEVFNSKEIEVQHDLLAAARATCLDKAGISCILGTGANACVYDGETITTEMVSLGYAMGDEGSGAYIGKQIVKAFLEKELPQKLHKNFEENYPELTATEVNQNVYQKPFPSRYLAGFFRFAIDNQQERYIHELVQKSFQLFLEKSVLKFEEHDKLPVHFVGGVAFYAQNIMRQVLQKNNLTVGLIIESPIAGLTLYHQNKSS